MAHNIILSSPIIVGGNKVDKFAGLGGDDVL